MKLNIDLSRKPLSPMTADMPDYPTFTITGDKELNLPKSGVMTIKFNKTREEHTENKNGMTYSCTIEVQKVVSASVSKGDQAPSKKDTSAGDALDKLAEEKSKEKNADEESEY